MFLIMTLAFTVIHLTCNLRRISQASLKHISKCIFIANLLTSPLNASYLTCLVLRNSLSTLGPLDTLSFSLSPVNRPHFGHAKTFLGTWEQSWCPFL